MNRSEQSKVTSSSSGSVRSLFCPEFRWLASRSRNLLLLLLADWRASLPAGWPAAVRWRAQANQRRSQMHTQWDLCCWLRNVPDRLLFVLPLCLLPANFLRRRLAGLVINKAIVGSHRPTPGRQPGRLATVSTARVQYSLSPIGGGGGGQLRKEKKLSPPS